MDADFNALLAMMMGMSSGDEMEYNEIRKLDHMLTQANIPHYFSSHMAGGFHITYFGKKGKPKAEPGVIQGAGVGAICSAIQTRFSYGSKNDRIEISGLLTDEEYEVDTVAGNLTAEDVFERIKKHWQSENM